MVLQLHQIPTCPFTGVRGWLSIEEDECLIALARRFDTEGAIYVNSGVEYGRSISILTKAAPLAKVYGVELSPKDEYIPQMLTANLHPTVLIGDALLIAKSWRLPLDLCFVDDCHSLNHLRKEIPLWAQHIKLGGVIAFHDTAAPTNLHPHQLHAEVQQALTEWLAVDGHNWKELESADSIRVFERIGK